MHEQVRVREEPLVRLGVGRQVHDSVPRERGVVRVQRRAPRLRKRGLRRLFFLFFFKRYEYEGEPACLAELRDISLI